MTYGFPIGGNSPASRLPMRVQHYLVKHETMNTTLDLDIPGTQEKMVQQIEYFNNASHLLNSLSMTNHLIALSAERHSGEEVGYG